MSPVTVTHWGIEPLDTSKYWAEYFALMEALREHRRFVALRSRRVIWGRRNRRLPRHRNTFYRHRRTHLQRVITKTKVMSSCLGRHAEIQRYRRRLLRESGLRRVLEYSISGPVFLGGGTLSRQSIAEGWPHTRALSRVGDYVVVRWR